MIEYKYADPLAFGNKWRPVRKFDIPRLAEQCNFDRYMYRICGEVFHRDTAAFRDALQQTLLMYQLMK